MREQPRSTPSTFLEYKSVLITVVTVCVCLVVQPCLTLCDPVVCSPPGSSVHGILQARVWSGVPFPSPGDLPNPGIEPGLLHCGQILYHLSHQGNPFLKSLLRLLQYRFCCFMFLFFFFWTWGKWGLSSPTRDWTPTPCISFSHCMAREVPTRLLGL